MLLQSRLEGLSLSDTAILDLSKSARTRHEPTMRSWRSA